MRQISIKVLQLMGSEKAFVENCTTGQTRYIEPVLLLHSILNLPLYTSAHNVEFPFKALPRQALSIDEALHNHGHFIPSLTFDGAVIHRDPPPPQEAQALLDNGALHDANATFPDYKRTGHEHHAHTVSPIRRKIKARFTAFAPEKIIRYLKEDTGPISGFVISANGTPMEQILQDLYGIFDDLMTLRAIDVDYKTDSACIMLKLGIIKALWERETAMFLGLFKLHFAFSPYRPVVLICILDLRDTRG
jgi:hypothetical protein